MRSSKVEPPIVIRFVFEVRFQDRSSCLELTDRRQRLYRSSMRPSINDPTGAKPGKAETVARGPAGHSNRPDHDVEVSGSANVDARVRADAAAVIATKSWLVDMA